MIILCNSFLILFFKMKCWFRKSTQTILSNSQRAFCFLVQFCLIKNINSKYNAITLIVILMLFELKLFFIAFHSMLFKSCFFEYYDKTNYQTLFEYIDNEIILSCNSKIIISLLCNNFFNVNVFCNFLKSHFLKVTNIIESLKNDSKIFCKLMIKRSSNLYFFWVVAISIEQNQKIIRVVMRELSFINFSMIFWTKTMQFFVQTKYRVQREHINCISRAREFTFVYLIRSHVSFFFTTIFFFD